MVRSVIGVFILSLLAAELGRGRLISPPGYDELFAKSDLVVIAEPAAKTHDTREHTVLTENISPGVSAIGVVTDFKCLLVLKGPKRQRFTLHHYRLAPTDGVIINGPTFTKYQPREARSFLMFLVRERDGRFAPAAGQIDPGLSVHQISEFE